MEPKKQINPLTLTHMFSPFLLRIWISQKSIFSLTLVSSRVNAISNLKDTNHIQTPSKSMSKDYHKTDKTVANALHQRFFHAKTKPKFWFNNTIHIIHGNGCIGVFEKIKTSEFHGSLNLLVHRDSQSNQTFVKKPRKSFFDPILVEQPFSCFTNQLSNRQSYN